MLKIAIKIFCALWLFASHAVAAPVAITSAEARVWANDKGQELLLTLSETDPIVKYAKLDKMMTEDVNLDYISKFVIGKYAKRMTAEQLQRYDGLFRRYALSVYKRFNLTLNDGSINFSIDNVSEHTRFTTVICTIDPGVLLKNVEIKKIPVKFKLIRGGDNRIQAVDVEISDVSMVIEYRKRFYQMIKDEDEDINWFLDKFNDTVRANEAQFANRKTI